MSQSHLIILSYLILELKPLVEITVGTWVLNNYYILSRNNFANNGTICGASYIGYINQTLHLMLA